MFKYHKEPSNSTQKPSMLMCTSNCKVTMKTVPAFPFTCEIIGMVDTSQMIRIALNIFRVKSKYVKNYSSERRKTCWEDIYYILNILLYFILYCYIIFIFYTIIFYKASLLLIYPPVPITTGGAVSMTGLTKVAYFLFAKVMMI